MHMSKRIIQIGTKFDISSGYSLLKVHCLHSNCQLTQDLIHIFRGEPLVRSSPSPTSGDEIGRAIRALQYPWRVATTRRSEVSPGSPD